MWTDDSDPIRLKVAGAQPLGEVVANLVGSVLPTRLDLVGRLTGWYRLEHEGVALPVEMNARDVPAERLTIRFVANTMMHADISVVSETQNARFVAPVGTAVPVTSLVDHLCCWMGLPAGEWRLSCGDRALAGYETIGDLGFGPAQVVPLRLWQSAE